MIRKSNNSRRVRRLANISYLLGVIFIVVSLALSSGVGSVTANESLSLESSSDPLQGPGNCGAWDAKYEGGPPWTYTSPNGELIKKVTIKAGAAKDDYDPCFSFVYPPENQQDACYRVTGLGTDSIRATKIGGDECKDISHIEMVFMQETPTPTDEPTATPTDEPTATPTDEPTATPTDEPTATPTDEPTATPTDEPTATPTDEPTATPTDEPTATPTDEPTATPTEGPSPTPTDTATPGPSPTPTDTDTPEPTPTDTNTPEPTETGTPPVPPDPTETSTPTEDSTTTPTAPEDPTDTPVPTLPPPTDEPGGEDVLIPVTGVDLNLQRSLMVRVFSNAGLFFLGMGIVLHGLSLRMKDED